MPMIILCIFKAHQVLKLLFSSPDISHFYTVPKIFLQYSEAFLMHFNTQNSNNIECKSYIVLPDTFHPRLVDRDIQIHSTFHQHETFCKTKITKQNGKCKSLLRLW